MRLIVRITLQFVMLFYYLFLLPVALSLVRIGLPASFRMRRSTSKGIQD